MSRDGKDVLRMTLTDAADEIVRASRRLSAYAGPENNLVFRNLYNGMCRINGLNRSFDDVVDEARRAAASGKRNASEHTVYGRAFREIWNWYDGRYASSAGSREVRNGISRAVKGMGDGSEELTNFRTPYSYRSFLGYLRNGNPILGGDGYYFLLHNAVAFLLPPDVTDQMLVAYGFMPLHIKNLFHIAVHMVLSGGNEAPGGGDPFAEVERCYREELEILNRGEEGLSKPYDGEEEAFASGSTRAIRQFVRSYYVSKTSMLSFIERHRSVFHRRHSRLIAEHRYLVTLFSELYLRKEIDAVSDRNDEARYSLYSFLRQFCRSDKTNRDTFRNEIYWKTARQRYHPTRELMILLWMYSFAFLYLPEVREESWDGSVRDYAALQPFDGEVGRPFADYVSHHALQVLRYLTNEGERSAPLRGFADGSGSAGSVFYGRSMIDFLNGKLEDYSWRPLDARSPFDLVILNLGKLDFTLAVDAGEQRVCSLTFANRPVDIPAGAAVENVPFPLVLFTELLQNVKERLNGALPLACKCSELM